MIKVDNKAPVSCGEHCATVEGVLHDTAEVPDLGHHLGLAGPVVPVGLGQDGDPLTVREEPGLTDPRGEEGVQVGPSVEVQPLGLGLP